MNALRFPDGPTGVSLKDTQGRTDFVADCFDRYGDIFHTQLGFTHLYYFRHPDHIQQALIQEASKLRKRQDLVPYLGQGLLTSHGELWKRQRRLIQPAFHSDRIAKYASSMVEETQRVIVSWKDGESRDISLDMMKLTLAIVCRAMFGHDTAAQSQGVAEVMQIYQSASKLGAGNVSGLESALKFMDEIAEKMISDRRATDQPTEDLLSWMLHAVDEQGAMTSRQLRDELLTFYLAGHETTSQALTWTWYLLSQNPSVEKKLHAELDKVLGKRVPKLADAEKLPYLDRIANESLRLYPPAYTLPRVVDEEAEIGGYIIPPGAQVLLCTYLCHRDPRWFPEPDEFKPDRWLTGSGGVLHPQAFFPFGAGPRACVGKHFARLELLLALATIARRFRLRLNPGQEVLPSPGVTLHPQNGLRMTIQRRNPSRR